MIRVMKKAKDLLKDLKKCLQDLSLNIIILLLLPNSKASLCLIRESKLTNLQINSIKGSKFRFHLKKDNNRLLFKDTKDNNNLIKFLPN